MASYYEHYRGKIVIGDKVLPAIPSAAHKAGIATKHQ